MPHKADSRFFDEKRPWSRQKDLILGYYLTAYLPKIATQRRPIQIVDAFAGPGKFRTGEAGSPLIIRSKIRAREDKSSVPIQLMLVDKSEDHAASLRQLFQDQPGVAVRNSSFLDAVPEIRELCARSSVFLYIDPYAIEGLEWAAMDSVFEFVERGQSIEILFNFNSQVFVRRGFAAIGRKIGEDVNGGIEAEDIDSVSASSLDAAVGGSWWRAILTDGGEFGEICQSIADGVCDRLRSRFNEVCRYDVYADPKHVAPKYSLLFGSRHPDALEIMNDATVKARDELAAQPETASQFLFEMRSDSLVPDPAGLPSLILEELSGRRRRGVVVQSVIRSNFCRFSSSQIRRSIRELLKSGVLASSKGTPKINDDDAIWRVR